MTRYPRAQTPESFACTTRRCDVAARSWPCSSSCSLSCSPPTSASPPAARCTPSSAARWRSLAPIQEGANRALKPVRDLFGWFGDTLDAKSERDKLRKPSATGCAAEVAAPDRGERERRAARAWSALDRARRARRLRAGRGARHQPLVEPGTRRCRSTRARATACGSTSRSSTATGLVGKVKTVSDGNAAVMLLTDRIRRLGAAPARRAGHRRPAVGRARRPAARPRAARPQDGPQGRAHHHRRDDSTRGCRRRSRRAS